MPAQTWSRLTRRLLLRAKELMGRHCGLGATRDVPVTTDIAKHNTCVLLRVENSLFSYVTILVGPLVFLLALIRPR